MAEKKTVKKPAAKKATAKKVAAKKITVKKPAAKTLKKTVKKTVKEKSKSNPRGKKSKYESYDDMSIVIVDDGIEVDQEKINEERRAYLEEARSQDVSD